LLPCGIIAVSQVSLLGRYRTKCQVATIQQIHCNNLQDIRPPSRSPTSPANSKSPSLHSVPPCKNWCCRLHRRSRPST